MQTTLVAFLSEAMVVKPLLNVRLMFAAGSDSLYKAVWNLDFAYSTTTTGFGGFILVLDSGNLQPSKTKL